MVHELPEAIIESSSLKLSRLPESYPTYVLTASGANEAVLAAWLFEMLSTLKAGDSSGAGKRIPSNLPCNVIWRGQRAWLIPRSLSQSTLAATYIGALELGGLFCLPNADSLRQYLPEALRTEVRQAGISDEPELRDWVEHKAREVAARLS
jgi:hypothetical protein